MKLGKWTIASIISAILFSACSNSAKPAAQTADVQPAAAESPSSAEPVRLRIAQQFGLGYAALTIADELGLFEKYLPELRVTWLQLGSDDAINEAFIAGEIDVAVMSIPPFLVGWDKGTPWKIASGLCVMPLSLQTYKPEVNNLADFGPDDKIAYPAPGSIQHILLLMAAEKQLSSPTALDHIGVAMAPIDAAAALINQKDITGHFTSPPYNFEEMSNPGIRTVLDGIDAFGTEFTFMVAVASNELFENNPKAYAALVMAIAEATEFINENPEEAAIILAPSIKLDGATTLKYITWPGMNYVTTPLGLMGFSDFMINAGFISKAPERMSEIVYPNVLAAIGKGQGKTGLLEILQTRP